MKKYIIITADTNDADYVTRKTVINDTEIKLIKEILSKLPKNGRRISWKNGDMGDTASELIKNNILTEEEVEFFEEYLPRGEYGIHTIESVEILEVTNEERLL